MMFDTYGNLLRYLDDANMITLFIRTAVIIHIIEYGDIQNDMNDRVFSLDSFDCSTTASTSESNSLINAGVSPRLGELETDFELNLVPSSVSDTFLVDDTSDMDIFKAGQQHYWANAIRCLTYTA